ncbi:MAG TPA: hypothetical protein VEB42_02855 [Chitinophagaceae bacterium]|nr:hypothetical protein [Chitinophagaceae bacterium]
MKRSLSRLPLLALMLLLFTYGRTPQNNWVKLATRTVGYTVDHSEVVIDGLNENLNALKVKVAKGAINLHRCVAYYQNGQTQDIDILNSIPQGGESKVIELPRSDQSVTKLIFVYDTKNRAIQKADIEFWGRK